MTFYASSIIAKSNKPTLKPMKPHSRATPFQNTYFIEYGLRVVTRNVNTHKVQSVECLFCVYFGRTPSIPDTRQRKLTSRIKGSLSLSNFGLATDMHLVRLNFIKVNKLMN